MKRVLIIVLLMMSLDIILPAQNYKVEGNRIVAEKTVKSSSKEDTGFTVTESDNRTYKVYVSESGSCFIEKVSKKTGKPYKKYLGKDISEEICRKISHKYNTKNE